ncbi:hypothetical protein [Agriterribacter sp.]|uniref:hypothetical protein n=1 Tax=Agriterribacter sp. TaxID=2821509 RepID=UPI002C19CA4F|nr:hypothetical protein [Agriterribacter sp.]HRO45573.1 hypothetical protein [Agriterribacter sp.]HRQ17231.1 hypothetical protein [Agriterribacter sp.]
MKKLTGFNYVFSAAQDNKGNETVYQLTSVAPDSGFSDWYGYVREDNQHFSSKEVCKDFFVEYRNTWVKKGKPH